MSEPKMTAPTTGADELPERFTLTITREQLPLLNDCLYAGFAEADVGQDSILMAEFRDNIKHQLHNQPATAVPDAEVRASAQRLLLIGMAVDDLLKKVIDFPQGLLILRARHEAFTEADYECLTAWLAQQEGRDER